MAEFFRDLLKLANFVWPEKLPETPSEKDKEAMAKWSAIGYDLIEDIFLDWDAEVTKHAAGCPALKGQVCNEPNLHFPTQIMGLEETGFRTRTASLPWPSQVFAQEPIRSAVFPKMKADKIGGYLLRRSGYKNMPDLVKARPGEVVNSTDLVDATNNFPCLLPFEAGKELAPGGFKTRRWKRATFAPNSVCKHRPGHSWPGLDKFIAVLGQWHLSMESKDVHHPNRMMEDLSQLQKKLDIQEVLSYISNVKEPKRKIRSFRPGKNRLGIGNTMAPQATTVAFDHAYTAGLEQLQEPLGPQKLYQICRVWYTRVREELAASGKVMVSGQLMSLPCSWVILNALNVWAARGTARMAATLGDDALLTTSTLEEYRVKIRSTGASIHPLKDMVSPYPLNRAVFAEFLLEDGEYVDHPKVASITQPKGASVKNRWSMVESVKATAAVKYLDREVKTLIGDLLKVKYLPKLLEAEALGLPTHLSPKFGGLSLPTGSERFVPLIKGVTHIEDPYRRLELWRKLRTLYIPKVYRGYGTTAVMELRPELVEPSDPHFYEAMEVDVFEDKVLHQRLPVVLWHSFYRNYPIVNGELRPTDVVGRLVSSLQGVEPADSWGPYQNTWFRVRGPPVDEYRQEETAPHFVWHPTH